MEFIATCFMVEESGRSNRYLRRFTYWKDKPCPEAEGELGHDAWEPLDTVEDPSSDLDKEETRELAREADENNNLELLRRFVRGDLWPHDDARWPAECELCGYEFLEEDEWQLHQKDLWVPADPALEEQLGEFELRHAEPGAMWDAYWMPHENEQDGRCLVARTPDGRDWVIDGPATNAAGQPGWKRKGKPPNVTVTPSIGTPEYHGYLIEGHFTADLEGRTYDS